MAATVMSIYIAFVIFVGTYGSGAKHIQKRSDDVSTGALEAQVTQLAAQLTSLTAQLTAQHQQLTSHQSTLTTVESRLETCEKVVAFYAWAASHPIATTPNGPIVLKHVQTNVGNGYDAETGYFTVPVSGLYQFHATFMAMPPEPTHAAIFVGGTVVAYTLSDSRHSYYDNVGLHATVHVNAGQRVHFQNADSTAKNFYGNNFLTFSGFLVRAD